MNTNSNYTTKLSLNQHRILVYAMEKFQESFGKSGYDMQVSGLEDIPEFNKLTQEEQTGVRVRWVEFLEWTVKELGSVSNLSDEDRAADLENYE